jgi:acetyltransferase
MPIRDEAIAPYPTHLETVASARDGTPVRLRPVRPEDEPLLQDLLAHMSHEDVRMRFFAPIRELSHSLAVRLTHIDYDREMALMAEHEGTILGVGRYFAEPDRARAEYAVAVRTDWKGRGIGYLLMTRLIALARDARIGELVGEVLAENARMLEMCRTLGFTVAPHPQDATLAVVVKRLAGA